MKRLSFNADYYWIKEPRLFEIYNWKFQQRVEQSKYQDYVALVMNNTRWKRLP